MPWTHTGWRRELLRPHQVRVPLERLPQESPHLEMSATNGSRHAMSAHQLVFVGGILGALDAHIHVQVAIQDVIEAVKLVVKGRSIILNVGHCLALFRMGISKENSL